MSIDPHAYNITIRRDNFDGDILYEARVKELPDLTEYGESYEDAYDLAVDSIETAAEAFAEKGRRFPTAMVPADDFSGRVTLRLPRSLHRSLARISEEEGVSLNQQLVTMLSYFSGYAASYSASDSRASWQSVTQERPQSARKKHLKLIHSETIGQELRQVATA